MAICLNCMFAPDLFFFTQATFIIYNTAENPISKTTSTDLYTSIADIFPAIFGATLKSIAKDPMHKLFGESEVTL